MIICANLAWITADKLKRGKCRVCLQRQYTSFKGKPRKEDRRDPGLSLRFVRTVGMKLSFLMYALPSKGASKKCHLIFPENSVFGNLILRGLLFLRFSYFSGPLEDFNFPEGSAALEKI